jgi:hypothetical protein
MEQAGIIEHSSSVWAGPIVPVKKNGSLWLCVDYRRLNAVSTTDAYLMPRVDDMIGQTGGAQIISALDLCKGYWHLKIHTAAYLDDVIIHSSSFEPLRHIQEILGRLRVVNLMARPKKCQFGMQTCTYLGLTVGNGRVRPELWKVEAV